MNFQKLLEYYVVLRRSCLVKRDYFALLSVFALAIAVRFYAVVFSSIVNIDGVIYIHLARALYFGQYEQISSSCQLLGYMPPTPFLIAGAYSLVHDWEIAGRIVSFIFGSMALLPIYLISKRYFSRQTCLLIMLVYALNPVLISQSAEVLKDSTSWFFLSWAFYFFVVHLAQPTSVMGILGSSFCFIMACWGRIEYGVFYFVTAGYLIANKPPLGWRLKPFSLFVAPLCFLALLIFYGQQSHWGILADFRFFRMEEFIAAGRSVDLGGYSLVRQQIMEIQHQLPLGTLHWFLTEARSNLWLIAVGSLVTRWFESFFYPYALLFLLGVFSWAQIRREYVRRYFALVAMVGLAVLYREMLTKWVVEYRYFVSVMIASFVFLGYGLDSFLNFLKNKVKLKENIALSAIVMLIISFGLAKSLKHPYQDKALYKEIGEVVARQSCYSQDAVALAAVTPSPLQRWVSFYANLHVQGAPCPNQSFSLSRQLTEGWAAVIAELKQKKITYFLLDEASWQVGGGQALRAPTQDCVLVGKWWHKDVGQIFLFRLR